MTTPRLPSRRTTDPTREEPRSSESFLVRLWKEPGSRETSALLRGSARQLRTGEERYFKSLSELNRHLLSILGWATAASREDEDGALEPTDSSGAP